MPVSSAAKLASHLWRGAAQSAASAAHNTGSTFRGAFHGASNGSGSSTASGWTSGLSSGGGSAGTGAGGAKYHAGRGAHSTYQQSSRALSQATTTSSDNTDGKSNDDDEDARTQHSLPLRITSPARQGHSLFLQTGNLSQAQMQKRFSQTFAPYSSPHFLEPTDVRPSSNSAFAPQPALTIREESADSIDNAVEVKGTERRQFSTNTNFILRNLRLSGHRRDAQGVRENIEAAKRLPNAQKNTSQFNTVIEALLRIREKGQSIGEIIDVYTDMIEAGHAPDSRTYAMLVQALCARDAELLSDSVGTREEDHYGRALELMDVAHNSKVMFNSGAAYNALIKSCALRGDVDRALSVLDLLEQSTVRAANADARTFMHLIRAFVMDSRTKQGESVEAAAARKLNACNQVFQEYKLARKSSNWDSRDDYLVWTALIEAHFDLNDPAGAVAQFETILKGGQGVPPLQPSLVSAMIEGFLSLGDTTTAMQWYLRMTPDQPNTPLPVPRTPVIESLISAIAKSDEQLDTLPRIFQTYIPKAYKSHAQPQLLALAEAVSACLRKVDRMVDVGRVEDANTTLDLTLTILDSYFGSIKPDKLLLAVQDQMDQAAPVLTALLSVSEKLLDSKRFVDAGSNLTWVGLFPQHLDISTPEGERLAERLKTIAGKFFGVGSPVVQSNLQLLASAVYVAPLLRDTGLLDESFATGLCNLYRQTRSESADFVTDLPLTKNAWNLIMDAFCFEESNLRLLDTSSFQTDSIPSLLHDLSRLPAVTAVDTSSDTFAPVARDSLDISQLLAVTVARHGEAALDLLPTWALEALKERSVTPDSPATQSEAGESSLGTASTGATSQVASPLQRDDLPETPLSATSGFSFAPVHVIDTDLGYWLKRDVAAAGANLSAKLSAFRDMLLEKMQTGTFADPQAVATVMVAFGRAGDADQVHELYAMAQHILKKLDGEPSWQASAWFAVEDLTIQALSYAGRPELATIHRHRIIAAGGALSASGYAALIATVRDTTDDASIAQELFEESRRFQVQPHAYLFNTVISKLSRARKADLALQLFEEMQAMQIQPNSVTYGAVINACTRIGDERNAIRLFESMEKHPSFKPRVPPYNTMMQYYIQSLPDREKAVEYYTKMQKAQVAPSAHTYKLLLDMYGSIEPVQVKEMEQIFDRVVRDPKVQVQGTHWASLINAYGCVLKDLDRAIATFDSIATHPSTSRSSSLLPDAISFEALLTVFVAHQRFDLMRPHVEKMQAAGIRLTAYVANLLIRGYCMEGEAGLQEARDLFESMSDPVAGVAAAGNHPPRVQGAGAPASADAVSRSLSPVERTGTNGNTFEGVEREPSTYEAMIRAELGFGNRDRALALVERMEARVFPPAVIVHARSLIPDANLNDRTSDFDSGVEALGLDGFPTHSRISYAQKSPRLGPAPLPTSAAAAPAASRSYSTSVRHASTMADGESGMGTSNPAPGPPKPNSPFTIFDRAVKTVQKNRAAARPASGAEGTEGTRGEASRQTDYVRRAIAESLADRVQDIKRDFPTIVELGAGPGLLRHYLTEGKGTRKIIMCDTSETLLYRDTHLDSNFNFEFERHVIDEERLPFEEGSLDCIVVSGGLHWTNDLPGALIQIRRALKPDGVFIGALCGGDTLFELRTSLQLAEQEREGGISPRISPMADTRDMASLLSRAGFTIPTVDVDEVAVGFPSMFELMHDLRDMGESNAVINRRGFLRRDTMLAASAIYESLHELPKPEEEEAQETAAANGVPADVEGVPATFQLIFLIGWSPAPTQPKPLKRGSASTNLKDVLAGEEGDVQAQAESNTQAPEEENKQLGQMLNSLKNHDDKKK